MPEGKTSIGVWVSDESGHDKFGVDDLDEFDKLMKHRTSGPYSRSNHIKQALLLYMDVVETIDGYPDPEVHGLSGHGLRATVRQAMLDHLQD